MTPKTNLGAMVGIGIQAVFLIGLACWSVGSEVISYRGDGTLTIDGRTLTSAGQAAAKQHRRGPAPGWELYGATIDVFMPQLWLTLALLAAVYAGMIVSPLWKRRWPSPAWWLFPLCVAAVGFFALAYLTKPAIRY